jgi:hypothetical protein
MKNRVTLYIPKMKKCSNKEPMMFSISMSAVFLRCS